MSQRLIELIKIKIASEGPGFRLKLALSIHRNEQAISRYVAGKTSPRPETAYILAKECGASDQEADAIKRECLHAGQKTA